MGKTEKLTVKWSKEKGLETKTKKPNLQAWDLMKKQDKHGKNLRRWTWRCVKNNLHGT